MKKNLQLPVSVLPTCYKGEVEKIKQILHATVLDIKVYYYPKNITIPRVIINQISKFNIFLVYSVHLHTNPCKGFQDRKLMMHSSNIERFESSIYVQRLFYSVTVLQ